VSAPEHQRRADDTPSCYSIGLVMLAIERRPCSIFLIRGPARVAMTPTVERSLRTHASPLCSYAGQRGCPQAHG
jgi:hypothetical protein